jgi:hypothetical protein
MKKLLKMLNNPKNSAMEIFKFSYRDKDSRKPWIVSLYEYFNFYNFHAMSVDFKKK